MIAGVCNFALNFFVILLASSSLSPSLIYPVMSVGSLACITVASIFLFKEKMKWWQWLGVAIGAMAVTILSL
jgi:drug/metabolite transporter (DMT)-like permease